MDTQGWYPVAAVTDLVPYHVHQAMLGGTELAVWRADDGFINVWENRCLHRGVRLTIGTTDGAELKCAYHGWRYANRSAGCTYIPAHPADSPARTICNITYPAAVCDGLVWTNLDADGASAPVPGAAERRPIRAMPMNVAADVALAAIEESSPSGGSVEYHVRPVDTGRCVVHGVIDDAPDRPSSDTVQRLRRHNAELAGLRDRLEAGTAAPTIVDPALRPPTEHPAVVQATPGRRLAPLLVRVACKSATATDIVAVELEPADGTPLPTTQAGAHIDLHLPNGLVRQYSLVNHPGDTARYRIGVKLVADSRGGSRFVHEELAEGDELAISEPRPSFPLRRDGLRSVLIAGGIGITPLLSMAQTLSRDGLPVELHYFARAADHLAFADVVDGLGSATTSHLGLGPDETAAALRSVIGEHGDASHLYLCGPPPMLETARATAADLGWPDGAVHFEYFGNQAEVDRSSSFELSLARSARTLTVEAGQSILDALQEAGVPIASSCEQGACGTCVATVLDGEPDHQDVRLSASERAAGDQIMTCVSRAASARLVLDL